MASTPKKGLSSRRLMNQIGYGMRSGGGMGAIMGFSGIPFLSKGTGAGKGSSSGPWMTVDPRNQTMFPGGFGGGGGGNGGGSGGGGGGGGGGGDNPAPDDLGNLGKVGGFPQWYIDWFKSQGMYGGVPPVQGLL